MRFLITPTISARTEVFKKKRENESRWIIWTLPRAIFIYIMEVLILDPWEFYSNRFVLAVARFVSRLPHINDSWNVVAFNKMIFVISPTS